MTKYFCDRCKKQKENTELKKTFISQSLNKDFHFELCDYCADYLVKNIKDTSLVESAKYTQ